MKATTIKIPETEEWILEMRQKARFYIEKYEGCTQSILQPFMEAFGMEDDLVLRAMAPKAEDRFEDAARMAEAVLAALSETGGPPGPTVIRELVGKVMNKKRSAPDEPGREISIQDFEVAEDSLISAEVTDVQSRPPRFELEDEPLQQTDVDPLVEQTKDEPDGPPATERATPPPEGSAPKGPPPTERKPWSIPSR